ncbi:disease resistance protein RUN1-like, partial [Vigna umbellata]|uniref:disease resistance protein RUN1-like n=1 Tax=Vigna umbellata TaxID=87088 RepID=UPI001F5E6B0A
MIRETLYGKKVLIVLGDVPNNYELLALWTYNHYWFSKGTVIIITTSDEDLLMNQPIDSIFRIERMNAEESLELFSWHAFREPKPKDEYEDLARRVVRYCGGLPLALEIVGKIIKVSIEGSLNEMEKDIFLDVCCFFVGKSKAYVRKILNGCGVDADIGIRVLMERNLIKINKNNKFGIHPLLQEIGEQIIREKSGNDLGKNRRLWLDKDAKYGTEALQWFPVKLPLVNNGFQDVQPT